eukprot:Filipodium_phascolosomae@DN838_c0_g1_i1.p1
MLKNKFLLVAIVVCLVLLSGGIRFTNAQDKFLHHQQADRNLTAASTTTTTTGDQSNTQLEEEDGFKLDSVVRSLNGTGAAGVDGRLLYTTTPSSNVFMRVHYKVYHVGKVAADKIAMHFKLCPGWKVDAESTVLPFGYFAKKDGDSLTKVNTLLGVEEWWIAGRELQSDTMYASQNTLYTPAKGHCQMEIKAYDVNGGKVGALKAEDEYISHDDVSKPEDVFAHNATLNITTPASMASLSVSFSTKSKYPKGSFFSIFFHRRPMAYNFPESQYTSANAQPDLKGCTEIAYYNVGHIRIACWERPTAEGVWKVCDRHTPTGAKGPALTAQYHFDKEEVPIGTKNFTVDIMNPPLPMIKDKVYTGVILSLQNDHGARRVHYAYVDPINHAACLGGGGVAALVSLVVVVVSNLLK